MHPMSFARFVAAVVVTVTRSSTTDVKNSTERTILHASLWKAQQGCRCHHDADGALRISLLFGAPKGMGLRVKKMNNDADLQPGFPVTVLLRGLPASFILYSSSPQLCFINSDGLEVQTPAI